MFYIANLETRAILTYRDGARMVYGNESLALSHAQTAEQMTGLPHCITPIARLGNDALQRAVAPWFERTTK